jgi:hypothetical protein
VVQQAPVVQQERVVLRALVVQQERAVARLIRAKSHARTCLRASISVQKPT